MIMSLIMSNRTRIMHKCAETYREEPCPRNRRAWNLPAIRRGRPRSSPPLLKRSDRLLQIGCRRAQQTPRGWQRIARASSVTTAEALIAHSGLASGDAAEHELRPRQKVGRARDAGEGMDGSIRACRSRCSMSVVNQDSLIPPEGVELRPGEIRARFVSCTRHLKNCLVIAMAACNDLQMKLSSADRAAAMTPMTFQPVAIGPIPDLLLGLEMRMLSLYRSAGVHGAAQLMARVMLRALTTASFPLAALWRT